MKLKVLDRKLLRTLWKTRGQALAIATVIMGGAAAYIAVNSVHRNLMLTRDTYYSMYRFADFEIMLERAPQTAVFKLETIPGVRRVRGRITDEVNVDVEGEDEPRIGKIVSMPDRQVNVINDIHISRGRYFEPNAQDEVIMSERFALENGLDLGDRIGVTVNNKKYSLRVVGLGLSPEYVYMIRNIQELIPSPERFGVLWVPETFAETALSMRSACNDIVGTAESEDALDEILDKAEKILDPYGVFVKIKKENQISNRFLSDEIKGLETSAKIFPTIFLAVASLILLVLLNRMVRKERTEIGLLKAYGHSSLTVSVYYVKYALILGFMGCVMGYVLGKVIAGWMIGIYVDIYQFPLLEQRDYPDILVRAFGLTVLFAVLGAVMAAWQAAKIDPAESMRAESPKTAKRTLIERIAFVWRNLSFTWKMIVRNVSRNRFRAGLSVFGVSISSAVLIMGYFSIDALEYMLKFQFQDSQREDVKVSFPIERGKSALHEASRFPHVRAAEPMLQYPFEIRSQWHKKDTIIVGLEEGAAMMKLIDDKHEPVSIGEHGLVMSMRLAGDLNVVPGDKVTLKPLQGRVTRETEVTVSKLVKQYLGTSGYMNLSDLSLMVDQSFAVNTVLLRTEEGKESDLNKALKDVPGVSSIEIKHVSYQNLKDTLAENMSVMNGMLVIFAGIIAFSVIYNVTTVALAERQRELASLRVMGFSIAEVGRIVYLENFLLAGMGLLLGFPIGMGICRMLVRAFDTELYRLPYHLEDRTFLITAGMITLFVLISNFAVRKKIHNLDMVEVLKARE